MIVIKTPFRHSPVIEKLPPLTDMGRDFYNLLKERKRMESLCGKKVKVGDISFSKDGIDGVNIINRLGRYTTTIFPDHFDGDIEITGELYTEPEVKEMTVEEVSELVGKTVKIVEKKDE